MSSEGNSFEEPQYTSTPNINTTSVTYTPFGRPIFTIPGTTTARFVTTRRRVTFSRNIMAEEGGNGNPNESGEEIPNPNGNEQPPPENSGEENPENPESPDWDDEEVFQEARKLYKERQKFLNERIRFRKHVSDYDNKLEEELNIAEKAREYADHLKAVAEVKQKELDKLLEDVGKQKDTNAPHNHTIRGARPYKETPVTREPEPRRRSTPGVTQLGTTGVFPQVTGPIPISFIQSVNLPSFTNLKGEDPRIFLEKYERINGMADDRTKVENLGQYLDGPAADWYSVLRTEFKSNFTLDDEGVQSNEWYELPWTELKRIFEKEFAEEKHKEIFSRNQSAGETGITYFYKMIKLHQQSELNLDESQLAALIIQHMTDNFKEKFIGKKFTSLEKLKDAIKSFDDRRTRELINKHRDRKRATISLVEEADDHLKKKQKIEECGISMIREELKAQINAIQQQMGNSSNQEKVEQWNPGRGFGRSYGRGNIRGYRRGYARGDGRGYVRGYGRGYGRGFNGNTQWQRDSNTITNNSRGRGGCYTCGLPGHISYYCMRGSRRGGNQNTVTVAKAIAPGPATQGKPENQARQ